MPVDGVGLSQFGGKEEQELQQVDRYKDFISPVHMVCHIDVLSWVWNQLTSDDSVLALFPVLLFSHVKHKMSLWVSVPKLHIFGQGFMLFIIGEVGANAKEDEVEHPVALSVNHALSWV